MKHEKTDVETLDFDQSTEFEQPNDGLVQPNGGLVKHEEQQTAIQTFDLNHGFPDLDKAEVIPFDLNSTYWTPKLPGETRRVIFDTIKVSVVPSVNDNEIPVELPCAFFFEKVNGEVTTVRNGSKRLVAILENNNIKHGTPLQIQYIGKVKNATNSYMSDNWSVKFLNAK